MGRDGQCVPEQMLPASVCLSLGALIWSVKGIRVCRKTELRDDVRTPSPGCLQLSRGAKHPINHSGTEDATDPW